MTAWPEWKPIESAPRDGRWVITWDGAEVQPACWEDDRGGGGSGDVGWCCGDSRWGGVLYEGINLMKVQPTHWMPLPTPPVTGEAE